jgi:hypothetical protein
MTPLLVRELYGDSTVSLDRKQVMLERFCAFDVDEHEAQVRARRVIQLGEAWAAWRR